LNHSRYPLVRCTVDTNGDVGFEIANLNSFTCYPSSVHFQLA